jgi:outer membrane protein assembly factor BamD
MVPPRMRLPRPSLAALAAATALAALGACGSSRVSITGEVKYGKSAEDDYKAGLEEMKSSSWPEASRFFEHCRTKYPFSKYAALAELRLADIKYQDDRFLEASEAYATFARMHPTHEDADYAAFREALSLLRDAPTDFFVFPPAYERELKSAREGVTKMEAFLAKWPGSKHKPEALKLLEQARGQLADHEWYVARFYAKRNRWAGVAGRCEALLARYPGSKHEIDALFALADAYARLEDRFKARQALQQLIVKHPDDPRRAQAEKLLARLR